MSTHLGSNHVLQHPDSGFKHTYVPCHFLEC